MDWPAWPYLPPYIKGSAMESGWGVGFGTEEIRATCCETKINKATYLLFLFYFFKTFLLQVCFPLSFSFFNQCIFVLCGWYISQSGDTFPLWAGFFNPNHWMKLYHKRVSPNTIIKILPKKTRHHNQEWWMSTDWDDNTNHVLTLSFFYSLSSYVSIHW